MNQNIRVSWLFFDWSDALDPLDPSLYDFDLPEGLIASEPPEVRGASRLLVSHRNRQGSEDHTFQDLPELLPPGAVLILNDTKVLPARLLGHRPTGGKVELLLAEPLEGSEGRSGHGRLAQCWRTFTRPASRVREGMVLSFPGGLEAVALRRWSGGWEVELKGPKPLEVLLEEVGHMPLPPYINRPDSPEDRERYQTVFAKELGAIAAPTAGLHFNETLLSLLEKKGHPILRITLHVGLGTFAPLREEHLKTRQLHKERYHIEPTVWSQLMAYKKEGRRIIACGTTSVRTLETAALKYQNQGVELSAEPPLIEALSNESTLFISDGFEFQLVDGLITNFHLPKSSLAMLVGAFMGRERFLGAYRHGIQNRYSFYSYGDANLIL